MTPDDVNRTIEAVWRIESPRLVAGLARIVRDVGVAEELAQDALVAALEQWPGQGVPDNPGAWLMSTAKHRAIDRVRRNEMQNRKHEEIGKGLDSEADAPDLAAAADDDYGDELLGLLFTTCHPVLPTESRVALTLRLLGGLKTEEIARAFLTPEATIGQRISRAKRTLAESGVAFEMPGRGERAARLDSVLEVIYLIFNEGYSATAGEDLMRPALCEEAMRLGRTLAELLSREPEVQGLTALMEIQASRRRARVDPAGDPILLLHQDRSLWDRLLVNHGLAALARAEELATEPGPYVVQAQIAACHARARVAADTDWARITELYETLAALTGSPVVELNRAMAVAMAHGPVPALQLVDELSADGELEGYHLMPSVRGDLLARLGRDAEAAIEFERAAGLTSNERQRAQLEARARELGSDP